MSLPAFRRLESGIQNFALTFEPYSSQLLLVSFRNCLCPQDFHVRIFGLEILNRNSNEERSFHKSLRDLPRPNDSASSNALEFVDHFLFATQLTKA